MTDRGGTRDPRHPPQGNARAAGQGSHWFLSPSAGSSRGCHHHLHIEIPSACESLPPTLQESPRLISVSGIPTFGGPVGHSLSR